MIAGLLRVTWSEHTPDGIRLVSYTKPWEFQGMPRIGDEIHEESLNEYSACTVVGVYGSGAGLIVEVDPVDATELTKAQRDGWPRRLRAGGRWNRWYNADLAERPKRPIRLAFA
jgi:hypothetical protein